MFNLNSEKKGTCFVWIMWKGDQILLTISLYVPVFMQSLQAHENNMDVSKNNGTPKSSILIGFSIVINHPFWGSPIFGNTHMLLKYIP